MIRRCCVPLSWLLLAACAPLPPVQDIVPTPVPPPPVTAAIAPPPAASAPVATPADVATRETLAFHDQVRQLAPPELLKELARVGDPPASPRATVLAAVLLGLTRSNGDLGRALGLLDPLLRSTAPEAQPWQPVARLLAARYVEQRRVEEQLERQNQQVRDNQRKLEQLNEKLEALKAIERSLTARPAGSAPAPAAAPPGARGAPP
ncbi:hypothetical protein [Piscinibacter sp. XHJ-5]|uniref:hypothetical protein n=1 Tax=Piscinibacter sp. XHJ-5 TaxID=3037797 RepID=UPI0024531006|nr:hypothetical protein [Piscinibacter sp. XHJ-5]